MIREELTLSRLVKKIAGLSQDIDRLNDEALQALSHDDFAACKKALEKQSGLIGDLMDALGKGS